jgi:hypothetical protein
MTAVEIQSKIGKPSFGWPDTIFLAQGYPRDRLCAKVSPKSMWVYYDDTGGSVCVYFDARSRVVCKERNVIVIAN